MEASAKLKTDQPGCESGRTKRMNGGAKEISAIDRVRSCTVKVETAARHACPALAARNTIHIFFSFLLRIHTMFVLKIERRVESRSWKGMYIHNWWTVSDEEADRSV